MDKEEYAICTYASTHGVDHIQAIFRSESMVEVIREFRNKKYNYPNHFITVYERIMDVDGQYLASAIADMIPIKDQGLY